jgi:hypothetical protein
MHGSPTPATPIAATTAPLQPSAPTPTPVGASGTTILRDDMHDASRGRLPVSGGGFTYGQTYVNGEYVVASPPSLAPQARFPNIAQALLPGGYADASIAVDARLVNPAPEQYAAMACRSQDPISHYRLMVFPATGTFAVVRAIAGGASPALVGPTASPAINTGQQTNRFELACGGSTIEATINGTRVATITDNSYRSGSLWIGAGHATPANPAVATPLASPVEAHFTNLVVTQL